MSFCNDVKSELLAVKLNKCCRKAEFIGLSSGFRIGDSNKIIFRTEQGDLAQFAAYLVDKVMGYTCNIKVTAGNQLYTVSFIADDFSTKLKSKSIEQIDALKFENACCSTSYIRGVFLSCGHIIDPKKNYRLDFILPDTTTAEYLIAVLNDCGFKPKISIRKNSTVNIYFNDSTSVEDLLTYMGATNCSLTLMEIKVEKSYTNTVNRKGNFDTANFIKTYSSSNSQLHSIEIIENNNLFDSLPDNLKSIAQLRKSNPDASLNELSQISGISKSTVDRRLKKITALADSLK